MRERSHKLSGLRLPASVAVVVLYFTLARFLGHLLMLIGELVVAVCGLACLGGKLLAVRDHVAFFQLELDA